MTAARGRRLGCYGLPQLIDFHVHVLKRRLPYLESDHVLNLTCNAISGGNCIEDRQWLRTDDAYLAALSTQRIPDPNTAGNFCRRFADVTSIVNLIETINETCRDVWRKQQPDFSCQAIVDADGNNDRKRFGIYAAALLRLPFLPPRHYLAGINFLIIGGGFGVWRPARGPSRGTVIYRLVPGW